MLLSIYGRSSYCHSSVKLYSNFKWTLSIKQIFYDDCNASIGIESYAQYSLLRLHVPQIWRRGIYTHGIAKTSRSLGLTYTVQIVMLELTRHNQLWIIG